MVFNYKKLLELHKQSGEKSIDFSRAIFGKESSLGPTYFKGKTEINTRHLEAMVRHYNVSYDYFFDDSTASHINIGNAVAHNRVGVGNVNINDDVKFLRQAMCKLEDEIKDKDEMINWLKGQINVLTELLKNSSNCLQKSEPKMGQ